MLAAERQAVGLPIAPPEPSIDSPLSWKRIVEPVEPFLAAVSRRLSEQVEEFEPEVAAYARYALTGEGKQLRPALVALSAESVGAVSDELVTVASIIEMVHIATLVHDDVIDLADTRRNRPTLAAECGNTVSVLVGDCLFAHALQLAAGFPTPDICRAVSCATKTVCTGEILQNQRLRRFDLSCSEYFRIIRMKTGELFGLSCDLGAWMAGCTPDERVALRGYGIALGTAYQIYDDCVDVFGNELFAGKSLGTDLASGKATLPLILALDRSTQTERSELLEMLGRWDVRCMPRLLGILEKYGVLAESQSVIRGFCDSARQSLLVLPASAGRQALAGTAAFLAEQTASLGSGS